MSAREDKAREAIENLAEASSLVQALRSLLDTIEELALGDILECPMAEEDPEGVPCGTCAICELLGAAAALRDVVGEENR